MATGNPDPTAICAALREMGRRHPTQAIASVVDSHLDSKFLGVQAVAAQVLAAWAWHPSATRLRAVLDGHVRSPERCSIAAVLARSLAGVVRASDTEDYARWFMSFPTYAQRFWLAPVIAALPQRRVVGVFAPAWATADRLLKHSMLIAVTGTARQALLELASNDADRYANALARQATADTPPEFRRTFLNELKLERSRGA